MRITKLKLFLFINGSIVFVLVCYFSLWFLSPSTDGKMISPYYANTITLKYNISGNEYSNEFMRNDVSYSERTVPLSYLSWNPAKSRVRSFMGICAEPLAWWFVFLVACCMLLLTDNLVFSKGTVFIFQRKFPWVSMEEFYPFPFAAHDEHEDAAAAAVNRQRLIGEK
ncbi:MAG: hypothetical protein ACJ749_16235 [Flavisolibacter sp.]